jgi:Flp pilus assembly protein TadD
MANPSTPSPFRSDPPAAPPAPRRPRRPPDLRTAQEHHKAGRLGEAEWAYRQWLVLRPGDAAALNGLGLVNHQEGRQHEALALLRQAAEYRSNLAAVLGRMGQHAAAAELAEAVRVRPEYCQGHCNLGVALEHCGRKEEAAAAYRRRGSALPAGSRAGRSSPGSSFACG